MSLLTCHWNKLIFANYIVPPEILEKHLPTHTQLDYFNGQCYVSLVGFQFRKVEIADVKVPFHTDFEEINLRCYVKRFDGQTWRKGTVFLGEIVDKPALAILANSLFRENYKVLPTRQDVREEGEHLNVEYAFKLEGEWQYLKVKATPTPSPYEEDGESEFIIHRLWGYGKHSEKETNEYQIAHPQWLTYPVNEYGINVDFTRSFGPEFSLLNSAVPQSVMLAEGSKVEVLGSSRIGGNNS